MEGEARGRREAIRQLAELRRRLAVAEETLTDALAAMKQAEGAFDAASDRFDAAERVLDAAREERAQTRRDRYAARQAYERASATADRLARRVRELAERLDGMAGLTSTAPRRPPQRADGAWLMPSRAGRHSRAIRGLSRRACLSNSDHTGAGWSGTGQGMSRKRKGPLAGHSALTGRHSPSCNGL